MFTKLQSRTLWPAGRFLRELRRFFQFLMFRSGRFVCLSCLLSSVCRSHSCSHGHLKSRRRELSEPKWPIVCLRPLNGKNTHGSTSLSLELLFRSHCSFSAATVRSAELLDTLKRLQEFQRNQSQCSRSIT